MVTTDELDSILGQEEQQTAPSPKVIDDLPLDEEGEKSYYETLAKDPAYTPEAIDLNRFTRAGEFDFEAAKKDPEFSDAYKVSKLREKLGINPQDPGTWAKIKGGIESVKEFLSSPWQMSGNIRRQWQAGPEQEKGRTMNMVTAQQAEAGVKSMVRGLIGLLPKGKTDHFAGDIAALKSKGYQPKEEGKREVEDFVTKARRFDEARKLSEGQVLDTGVVAGVSKIASGLGSMAGGGGYAETPPTQMFESPKQLAERGTPITEADKFSMRSATEMLDPTNVILPKLWQVPGVPQITKAAGTALEAVARKAPAAALHAMPPAVKKGVAIAGAAGGTAGLAYDLHKNPKHAPLIAAAAGGLLAARYAGKLGTLMREGGELGMGGMPFKEGVSSLRIGAAKATSGVVGGGLFGAAAAEDGNRLQGAISGGIIGGVLAGFTGGNKPIKAAAVTKAAAETGASMPVRSEFAAEHNDIMAQAPDWFRTRVNAMRGHFTTDSSGPKVEVVVLSPATFQKKTGADAAGFFDAQDQTIYLNAGSGDTALGHEAGHAAIDFLASTAGQADAQAMRDIIKSKLSPDQLDGIKSAYALSMANDWKVTWPEAMKRLEQLASKNNISLDDYMADEALAEQARKLLDSTDPGEFGRRKGIGEKILAGIKEHLRVNHGLQPMEGSDITNIEVKEATKALRELFDVQGRRASDYRKRTSDIESGKVEPTAQERIDQISRRLEEIREAPTKTPAMVEEFNTLGAERDRLMTGLAKMQPQQATPEPTVPAQNATQQAPEAQTAPPAPQNDRQGVADRIARAYGITPQDAEMAMQIVEEEMGPNPNPEEAFRRVGKAIEAIRAYEAQQQPKGGEVTNEERLQKEGQGRQEVLKPGLASVQPAPEAGNGILIPREGAQQTPQAKPGELATLDAQPETTPVPEIAAERAPERLPALPEAPGPEQAPAEVPTPESIAAQVAEYQKAAEAKAARARSPKAKEKALADAKLDALKSLLPKKNFTPRQLDELQAVRDEKTGEITYTGRINKSNPLHAEILKHFGYNDEQIGYIERLQDNLGDGVVIRDYQSAEQEGVETGEDLGFSGQKRNTEYTASPAEERSKGLAAITAQDKGFTPVGVELTGKGINILGFDHDKFFSNVRAIMDAAQAGGIKVPRPTDAEMLQYFQDYSDNHVHGYKGDGSAKLKTFPDTGITPDESYTPKRLPEGVSDLINMALHIRSARPPKAPRGKTELALAKFGKAQDTSRELIALNRRNNGFLDEATGETNRLRSEMEKGGLNVDKLLKPTLSNIRPDLIKGGIATDRTSVENVHAHGYEGIPAGELSKFGLPKSKIVGSGFMPRDYNTEKRWFHGTTARNFSTFKKGNGELGEGVYVTDRPDVARAWSGRPDDKGGRIYPLFLKRGELFELSRLSDDGQGVEGRKERIDAAWREVAQRVQQRAKSGDTEAGIPLDWADEPIETLTEHIRNGSRRSQDVRNQWLKAAGYIGATMKGSQIAGQAVIFDPSFVKSAIGNRGTFNPAKKDIRFMPKREDADQIVPAIKVADRLITGIPGDTHQDILNRFMDANPDSAADALVDFDTKENPNLFVDAEGNEISREQLKEKFGVSDSQGLKRLQGGKFMPRKQDDLGFYSKLEEVVTDKLPNKASKQQILATLDSAGVKKEESDWMGLGDWLESMATLSTEQPQSSPNKNLPDIGVIHSKLLADIGKRSPALIEGIRRLDIPSDLASEYASSVHDVAGNPKYLGDLGDFLAAGNQALGSLNGPLARMVVNGVRAAIHDRKIRNSVIELLPVDVMNNLVGQEFSSEMLLDDVSVLENAFSIDNDKPIPAPVDAAVLRLMRGKTSLGAKMILGAMDVASESRNRRATSVASDTDLGHANNESAKQSNSKLISKKELLDFIRSNQVELREVSTSQNLVWDEGRSVRNLLDQEGKELAVAVLGQDDIWRSHDPSDPEYTIAEDEDWSTVKEQTQRHIEKQYYSKTTKFEQYTLPGGENYNEVLLTLPPPQDGPASKAHKSQLEAMKAKYGDAMLYEVMSREEKKTLSSLYSAKLKEQSGEGDHGFKSTHWDEPNVLVHIRQADHQDTQGRKVRLIEEIQSDWHQKGRKEGYKGGSLTATEKSELDKLLTKFGRNESSMSAEEIRRKDELYDRQDRAEGYSGVPDAPFKKSWPELAFKRALRMAVEDNMDVLAWVPGEIQAERYDLSKQIDSLRVEPRQMGGYDVQAYKEGTVIIEQNAKDDNALADLIGKDLAAKISEQTSEDGEPVELSGLQLKVGGSGMAGFYDKILLDFVRKYVKKWGGKVETTEMVTGQESMKPAEFRALPESNQINIVIRQKLSDDAAEAREWLADATDAQIAKMVRFMDKTTEVHSVTITDAMRESVLSGQAKFMPKKSSVEEIERGGTVVKVLRGEDGRFLPMSATNEEKRKILSLASIKKADTMTAPRFQSLRKIEPRNVEREKPLSTFR